MGSPEIATTIRPATAQDREFLERMCYCAGYPVVTPDTPPLETARLEPWFQEYVGQWGERAGDIGLIASEGSTPLGAVWVRDHQQKNVQLSSMPPYELTLAITPEARGRGLGELLLVTLMGHLHDAGVASVGLQVERGNEPARHLYRKLGFTVRGEVEDLGVAYDVMVAPTDIQAAHHPA